MTWKITHIIPAVAVGQKGTLKGGLVLEEVKDQYPNTLAVDLFGDKTEWLSNYNVGDEITLEYNTKASEYNGKWYNSISAWKIDKVKSEAPTKQEDFSELPF